MKRILSVLFAIFLFAAATPAQEPVQQAKPATAVVRFGFDWPAQNPPRYSITVDANGHATYRSEPAADANGGSAPEPYTVEWNATDDTRRKIFEDVEKANYLHGNFEAKAKVAMTGMKTLAYKDASHDASATFNYSENPEVRDLTHIFQSIAFTAEVGRKLEHDIRFDKLGVDSDLKGLQEQQKQGNAMEFGSIAPLLQKIASDYAMMRMSQQRAKEMLRSAGLSSDPPAAAEK